jgi:hypothetical protein
MKRIATLLGCLLLMSAVFAASFPQVSTDYKADCFPLVSAKGVAAICTDLTLGGYWRITLVLVG